MARKWDIDVSQSQDDWYLTAKIGPFRSRDEAVVLCRKIAALGMEDEAAAPPALGTSVSQDPTSGRISPLGINVSETITATDKFGG